MALKAQRRYDFILPLPAPLDVTIFWCRQAKELKLGALGWVWYTRGGGGGSNPTMRMFQLTDTHIDLYTHRTVRENHFI